MDVGTNAELVLGSSERLLAASSPTGPAFEGAQISCGQRAAPGVIERVRIDPTTLEPRYRVIGDERWSGEPGFVPAPSGICGSGIVEALAEMFLAGILAPDGTIDGSLAERTRASSAPAAPSPTYSTRASPRSRSPRTTCARSSSPRRPFHAGRAPAHGPDGNRLRGSGDPGRCVREPDRPKYALILGMVPDCEPGRVTSAGNAAGTGGAHRPPQPTPSPRARTAGAPDREGRDGGGAEVPGALRGCDGDPAPDRPLSEAARCGDPPLAPARPRGPHHRPRHPRTATASPP